MNKSILISIKPEWVCKILNGEKTIEIRKTMPKCKDFPIDVYIYCTKSNDYNLDWAYGKKQKREYFCWDKKAHHYPFEKDDIEYQSQKVLAKFTLNKIFNINPNSEDDLLFYEVISCLKPNETEKYLKNKNGYAWQIDNLVIFDEPKELKDFYKNCREYDKDISHCGKCNFYRSEDDDCIIKGRPYLTKAPQSWCYVEVGDLIQKGLEDI